MEDIAKKLAEHEQKQGERHNYIVERLEALASDIRSTREVADIAHATALEAKHAAGKVSIDAEGGDQGILAELGSLKVVLGEHAKQFEIHETNKKNEKRVDAKARRFWRIAQPAIIAITLALLNRLTFLLAPPAVMPEPPIKIEYPVKITSADAGTR